MSTSLTNYALPDSKTEVVRLNQQYIRFKKLFGRTGPLPTTVDITSIDHVLEVAAGTCAWTLDVAHLEEVYTRLPSSARPESTSKAIQLYACDISTDKFPPRDVTDALGIRTFQQDVTQPFPDELYGKFDLVQAFMLVSSLTEDGWRRALENYRRLLKPGGILFMLETDVALYSTSLPPPPPPLFSLDIDGAMDGLTWIHGANRLFTGFNMKRNLVSNISYRLPALLTEHSLGIIQEAKAISPIGKLCKLYCALDGADLSDDWEDSVQGTQEVFRGLAQAMLRRNMLEVPKGTPVTTQEGLDELLAWIFQGLELDGACNVMTQWVIRRIGGE